MTTDISLEQKTIAIMGATGAQGGATVRAFAALKESGNTNTLFKIRAITRNPDSEKAVAIRDSVDEIVQANADDVESMTSALEGCYGAFLVSNFWDDMNVDHEMQILRNLKEAVKKAGVKHVVLSTLEDVRDFVDKKDGASKDTWKVLNEEHGMYVPHFDGKGAVTKEFQGENLPVTYLYTTFYMENFIYFGMGPSRQSDSDPYAVTFPMGKEKLSMVTTADIGKMACAIFQDSSLIGKSVGVQSEALTCDEIAATFEKVCGQKVVYNAVPWDVYASFGFPGADDLANMFRFYEEDAEEFLALRNVSDEMKEKMGGVTSFEQFVIDNKAAFQIKQDK